MYVFLDESGDLGWNFEKPFRSGGSSRFLTLAFLIVSDKDRNLTKRLVRKFLKYYGMNVKREIKGAELSHNQRVHFANEVVKLLSSGANIKIRAITVMKENVRDHIRSDPNKLYNYMINLCILDLIENDQIVYFTPDPRSIKVSSGDSMVDYLQTQLWFEKSSDTVLIEKPHESHSNLNLQFIDVITNMVWSHYEDKKSDPFKIIAPHVPCKNLFFR